jgi:predicted AAA+ superfamily ATPase
MYFHRGLEKPLQGAFKHFPAVFVTGSRQTGKSTLLQYVLKEYIM